MEVDFERFVIDAIRNEQGDLLGFAKVTRDITDKKKTRKKPLRRSLGTSNCSVSVCRTMHAPRGFSTTRCRRLSAGLR